MALSPGIRIGVYEVQSAIGAGGMGEVYRARDTKLGRTVALKVLPDHLASDADRLARFLREAQLLASLSHPNIAGIHGLEDSGGVRALVLEFVDGETLARRIDRGPLPPGEALNIARQIADALDAAHEQGIVHRDLKPGNVQIAPGGVVKVLDFGLAKLANPVAEPPSPLSASPTLTSPVPTNVNVVVGTVTYMSPEQARGQNVDKRTDIWAFGCVFYEMLTGRAAFAGPTFSDVIAAILDREPAWDALPPALPPSIRRLLQRTLDKDVKRRVRDIGDARVEIEDALQGRAESTPASAAPPRGSRGRMWAAIAAAALALLALVAILWRRDTPQPVAAAETRLEITTSPTQDVASMAIAPDGSKVAFVAPFEGARALWLRALNASASQPLPGTTGALLPFWSPDSRSIGFFADGKVKRIDTAGGSAQTLADAPNPHGGAWLDDDTIVFTPHQVSPLLRVSIGTRALAPATTLDPGHLGHILPSGFSGRRLVLFQVTGRPDVRGAYASRLDGSAPRKLAGIDPPAVFGPRGHILFVRGGTLMAQAFDAERLEVTGTATRVADDIAIDRNHSSPIGALAASANGSILYRATATGAGRQLTWVDRSGTTTEVVGGVDAARVVAGASPLALSPDGRRLALVRSVDGNSDIWLLEMGRNGAMSRFTFDAAGEGLPVWSPDGGRIAFSSPRTGVLGIFQRPIAGGEDQLVLGGPLNSAPVDFSPDGKVLLALRADPVTHLDIWAVPVDPPGDPYSLITSPFEDLGPQFDPTGTWVAYQSSESGHDEVYVRPFARNAAATPVSTGGGIQPRWRRDGKELFFVGSDGRLMATPIAWSSNHHEIDMGTPRPLFQTPIRHGGLSQREYIVAPDGQRFLIDTPVAGTPAPLTLIQNWKATTP